MPWSSQAVIAQTVIIEGPSDGLFVYNGTPAAGNLIASIASAAGTDQFGNAFQQGITSYLTSEFSELNSATLILGSTNAATRITAAATVSLVDALTDAASPGITVAAAGTTAGSRANVTLFGESKDASSPAQVVMNTTGALGSTGALLEVQGTQAIQAAGGGLLTITETAGGPATPPTQFVAHAGGNRTIGVQVTGDTNQRLAIDANGAIAWGSGSAAPDTGWSRQAANLQQLTTADLTIAALGRGYRTREGANCKQGTATLSAGTILVSNTSVTAVSRIFLTPQDNSTTGALRVSARTAGTSFTITSSNAGDSGVVAYEIFEPG